jgi:hypothetical protein
MMDCTKQTSAARQRQITVTEDTHDNQTMENNVEVYSPVLAHAKHRFAGVSRSPVNRQKLESAIFGAPYSVIGLADEQDVWDNRVHSERPECDRRRLSVSQKL